MKLRTDVMEYYYELITTPMIPRKTPQSPMSPVSPTPSPWGAPTPVPAPNKSS